MNTTKEGVRDAGPSKKEKVAPVVFLWRTPNWGVKEEQRKQDASRTKEVSVKEDQARTRCGVRGGWIGEYPQEDPPE